MVNKSRRCPDAIYMSSNGTAGGLAVTSDPSGNRLPFMSVPGRYRCEAPTAVVIARGRMSLKAALTSAATAGDDDDDDDDDVKIDR